MERNRFLEIKPMLLEEVSKPFNSNDYIFELKFDGIRSLIYIDKNEIIIRSRNGVILNDIYPELNSIRNITKDTCIFDGEIVLLYNDKPSFTKVMERFKLRNKNKILLMKENFPVTFVCFDILYKNKDLTNLTLLNRKKILDKFKDTKYFVKSKYFEEKGKALFGVVRKNNLEGIVAKRKDSKYYYDTRTKDWIKIKNWKQEQFLICGYELTKNNAIITIILGEKKDSNFYYVGKVIMGDKNNLYKKIINSKRRNSYLKNYDNEDAFIINPKYIITINYIERTKENMLREAFIKK